MPGTVALRWSQCDVSLQDKRVFEDPEVRFATTPTPISDTASCGTKLTLRKFEYQVSRTRYGGYRKTNDPVAWRDGELVSPGISSQAGPPTPMGRWSATCHHHKPRRRGI